MIREGQIIRMTDSYEVEDNARKQRVKQYRVLQIMKNTVLMEDKMGFKRCVPRGELIRLGYMKQAPYYEALREERNEKIKGYTRAWEKVAK